MPVSGSPRALLAEHRVCGARQTFQKGLQTRRVGNDNQWVLAAHPLTVSIVAKIQVVRSYSPGLEKQRIDNNWPDNEQHR